jgi:SAM-dependent methyltransferase
MIVKKPEKPALQSTGLWFVDPAHIDSVSATADGIVTDGQSAGTYSDIPAEQTKTLLSRLAAQPWRQVIKDLYENQNPWLYRIVTDPSRATPMELFDLHPDSTCLDVGSGWGQLAIPLSQAGCRVVALDLTLERLRALRFIAGQEEVELSFAKGNILTFPFQEGAFDIALFNGALEWVGTGRGPAQSIRQCQVLALRRAARALKTGGILYIGIENSIGLKYLMGARDDHTSLPFFSYRSEEEADAMMRAAGGDRTPTKTWGLGQLRLLASEAGLGVQSVYGCFPDYKIPRHLVPLEDVNEFLLQWEIDWTEHHGDRGEPLPDQDAVRSAYRQLADSGIAQWFCPSYAIMLVKP